MNSTWPKTISVILLFATTLCAQPPQIKPESPEKSNDSLRTDPVKERRVSLAVARDRAELMHRVYEATLEVMHDRYFHGDRAIVPARAMQDVFAEMQRQSDYQARWIAVNLKAMSVDHEVETEFEKRAAKEISAGKSVIETIENGYYRRAGAIPLGSNCISCHAGFFRTPPTKPKFAGLVISIPLRAESAELK